MGAHRVLTFLVVAVAASACGGKLLAVQGLGPDASNARADANGAGPMGDDATSSSSGGGSSSGSLGGSSSSGGSSGGGGSCAATCTGCCDANGVCNMGGLDSGACTGGCTPGATQCSGNGVETCRASGAWSVAVACTNRACMNGACQGVCTPNAAQCSTSGNGVETCSASGTWGSSVTCTNSTCVSGACAGTCAPGQVQCSGQQPQNCSATGAWQKNGSVCTDQTCVSGTCNGNCAPGQTRCSGEQPQTCGAGGAWQDNGGACMAPQTCVGGVCAGVDCSTYTAPVCNGTAACDLRTNTCCVTPALPAPTGRCVADGDSGGTCNGGESPFHCQYACECPTGDSCCGVINKSTYAGSASCEAVANGGACTSGTNQAAAQLCKQDAECKNGQRCIAQTCVFGSMFHFCGVQSQSPFNCTANPTDAGGQ